MLIAILVGTSALLGAACAALGWSHARKVVGATSSDLGALVIALKKLPEAERLGALAKKSRPGSWERRMADEALAAPDAPARVAAVNEALDDIEHLFKVGAGWSPAGIRIAFFGAALLAVVAYLADHELRWALVILGIGGASALTCIEAGRAARRGVEAQRRAIDDLISTALGPLVEAAGAADRLGGASAGARAGGRPRRRGGRR